MGDGGDRKTFPVTWFSDAPMGRSGYASQTALFAPRLQALGYTVNLFANNLQGESVAWNGMRVYPRFADRAGNDLIHQVARHTHGGEGLNWFLHDVWVYEPSVLAKMGHVAAWTPVDHEPLQFVADDTMRQAGAFPPDGQVPRLIPVAMSRFAEESFKQAGYDAPYVPHAFDGTIYYPRDRAVSRKMMGVPEGAFLVGMVGDNQGIAPPRKGWPLALRAFKEFQAKHPQALLYLHTDVLGVRGGLDLTRLLANLDIPKEAIYLVDPFEYRIQSFSTETMAHLYSACEVVLHPSYGEGFGLVQLEANACGTPVIATNFSSMPEVGYGWHVEGDREWTALGGWQVRPHVHSIVQALKHAYHQAGSRREKAVAHAAPYEITKVMHDYMLPALDELSRRFGLA